MTDTTARDAKILTLRTSGMSLAAIGERFGLTHGGVNNALKRARAVAKARP